MGYFPIPFRLNLNVVSSTLVLQHQRFSAQTPKRENPYNINPTQKKEKNKRKEWSSNTGKVESITLHGVLGNESMESQVDVEARPSPSRIKPKSRQGQCCRKSKQGVGIQTGLAVSQAESRNKWNKGPTRHSEGQGSGLRDRVVGWSSRSAEW